MMWPQLGQENTTRLNLEDIGLILRARRLLWFGYMERSSDTIITACDNNEPRYEISNNVVCASRKVSDQPAHTRSLIRAFASRLNTL